MTDNKENEKTQQKDNDMKNQSISINPYYVIIAVVFLALGYALSVPFPANELAMENKGSDAFNLDNAKIQTQITLIEDYAEALSGTRPELTLVDSNYDGSLIVVNGRDQNTGSQVDLYFTKEYKFIGFQEPIDLEELVSQVQAQSPQLDDNSDQNTVVDVSLDDDPSKGAMNATVVIVEFSDFECPYCSSFYMQTLPLIEEQYIDTGLVRLVYRDFPLTSIHPNAQKAAEAAECADDQGKFWEMHDMLFENQNALTVASLKGYAKELGLDSVKFDSCLDSGEKTSEVTADLNEGIAYGITGTPGFFVNGRMVVGALPFSSFKQIIDEELAKAS